MKEAQFGGVWTREKLERVRKYLTAYATIMNKRMFRFAYIDAFAGTGYLSLKQEENPSELMFPELVEREPREFLEGSARIALQVRPRFAKYIFIEKHMTRFTDLQELKTDFPELKDDIELVNRDANAYLRDLCQNYDWHRNRAVLFLDPYGMQVLWETVAAIANTKAIDLWYLFPIGVAVNRLLRRDGKINLARKRSLDLLFGTEDWLDTFYRTNITRDLFGTRADLRKVADFKAIARYFVARLETIFAEVADNPLFLYSSKNIPLYLLCFASGNPRGAKTAIKIAQDILRE